VQGTFYFSDGTVYKGDFINDTFQGRGIMTYQNGDEYDG